MTRDVMIAGYRIPMRADRLISIVLLLQANGRMTAENLASRLEVSQRTILRDMDALSSAGVPVVAERGTGGGWRLIDGYETKLTGLTPAEIRSLFLARPPALLAELGLRKRPTPPGSSCAPPCPSASASRRNSCGNGCSSIRALGVIPRSR